MKRFTWHYVWLILLIAALIWVWVDTLPLHAFSLLGMLTAILPVAGIVLLLLYEWRLHKGKTRQ